MGAGQDEADPWEEITAHLAAVRLRSYLEYVFSEICQKLRVSVEYRGDAQHNLGELLPPAISHFKELMKKGKESANSWGRADKVKELEAKEKAFSALVAASSADQWQINPAIHYNNWENFGKADFTPVAKAFKELIEAFDCPQCNLFVWVEPERGPKHSIRCECCETTINLLKK